MYLRSKRKEKKRICDEEKKGEKPRGRVWLGAKGGGGGAASSPQRKISSTIER